MFASRALALLLAFACTGCWVCRIGPNYEYEPEGDAWHARSDLRRHSMWRLTRDGVTWKTEVWRYRGDMLVLELFNANEVDKRVRVHGVPGGTYRWRAGHIGDSNPGPMRDERYGEGWITLAKRHEVSITLKLEDLRGTPKAREGDRVRFAIEDSVGRLDCEFRLERIAYDYRLLPVIGD